MVGVKTSPVAGSNEIVERVAIAIFVSWYEGSFCDPVSFYTDCDGALQDDYRRIARAAIAALREPTEAMCKAGGQEVRLVDLRFENGKSTAEDTWQAMIDAAL